MPNSSNPNPAKTGPEVQASAQWVSGEVFLTNGTSGHAVVMDAAHTGGSACGPMEMVLRSLCACSAVDVVLILKKARQGLRSLDVSAQGERAGTHPSVYKRIHVVYRVAGEPLERAVVERAVALSQEKYCSVFATLSQTAAISHEIVLEAAPAGEAAAEAS